nr:reverse transcriptase domain-containing protein [Tanacetum cinerariifolium]
MQSLSGKLAALNRFLSKAAKRVIPCLDTLKKYTNKKDFHWIWAAEEAFQAMKKFIVELPTLISPMKGEELMVYLPAANEAVSVMLLVERSGGQMPIHYVSRSVQGAKVNYVPMKKLALALVHATRSQRPKNKEVQRESPRNNQLLQKFPDKSHTKGEKKKADALSKLATVQCKGLTKWVSVEELNERSVDMAEVNVIVKEEGRTWITPIREYIKRGTLPKGERQANYVIREIHMGSCEMLDRPRKVVHKAMSAGYYWPSMHRDANREIRSCDSCQVRSPSHHHNGQGTQLINEPFKSWAEGLGIKPSQYSGNNQPEHNAWNQNNVTSGRSKIEPEPPGRAKGSSNDKRGQAKAAGGEILQQDGLPQAIQGRRVFPLKKRSVKSRKHKQAWTNIGRHVRSHRSIPYRCLQAQDHGRSRNTKNMAFKIFMKKLHVIEGRERKGKVLLNPPNKQVVKNLLRKQCMRLNNMKRMSF